MRRVGVPGDEDSLPPPIPKITPANTPYVLCSSCTAAPVTLIEQWLVHVAICVALAEANSDDSAGALRGNTTVLHETDGSKRYSRDGDSACGGEDDIYVLWPRHLPRQRRLRLGLGYSNCTLADFTEFFGPDGIEQRFFQSYLAPFVDTRRSPWRAVGVDGQSLGLSRKTLAGFEQARRIRRAFFAEGEQPRVDFKLRATYLDAATDLAGAERAAKHAKEAYDAAVAESAAASAAADAAAEEAAAEGAPEEPPAREPPGDRSRSKSANRASPARAPMASAAASPAPDPAEAIHRSARDEASVDASSDDDGAKTDDESSEF